MTKFLVIKINAKVGWGDNEKIVKKRQVFSVVDATDAFLSW
jgi:hypothetical protein